MQNVIDKLELMFAGMGAFLGWFFGGFDGFFYALVVFVTCDYFTGVLAAAVRHELSSEVGFKGIAKKVYEFHHQQTGLAFRWHLCGRSIVRHEPCAPRGVQPHDG